MPPPSTSFCAVVFFLLLTGTASSQTIVLYENGFITPNLPITTAFCGTDLDITPVNDHWAGTGGGTGGGGLWAQVNTVETILINGPGNVYNDPMAIGGDYCIGMLSSAENDLAALTLDRDTLPFVNLVMDISPVEVSGCGGPFGTDVPRFRVVVYDSPGGIFNIFSPGTVLDEDTLTGVAPTSDPFELNWVTVGTGLDVSGATDGFVTVLLDLIQSGYAVFDNIEITASVSQLGVGDLMPWTASDLYPNPVADVLQIRNVQGPSTWMVHGADGKIVLQGLRSPGAGIDVSKLTPGAYLMRYDTPVGLRTMRFVKE